MQADHPTISKTLNLYAQYLDIMDIDINDRPVLTFTKQEYRQAIGTDRMQYMQKNKISDRSLDKVFGQCSQKYRQWNSVIFLNMEQFAEYYGLHEHVPIDTITKKEYCWTMYKGKRVRAYHYVTYQRFRKVAHLEETLVHELLHHKKVNMKHGKRFNSEVEYYIRKRTK